MFSQQLKTHRIFKHLAKALIILPTAQAGPSLCWSLEISCRGSFDDKATRHCLEVALVTHMGMSGTIRESNQASDDRKAHYA